MISGYGLPSASVIASCISVTPPPEYLAARERRRAPSAPGRRSTACCRSGSRPASAAAPTGDSPGKPKPSPRPDVWLINARGVTGWPRVNSLSGSFHDFSIVLMSSSSAEPPVLNRAHRRHRGDRLADRRRLEQRVGVDPRAGLDVCHAVSLRPVDLEILDDRDAHARHVKALHHLLQRERIEPLPVGRLRALRSRAIISAAGRPLVGDCVQRRRPPRSA